MKNIHIVLLAAVLTIAACKGKKNTTSTNTTTTNTSSNNSTPVGPTMQPKSKDGLFEPGQEELTAVQAQFKDVNMDDLKNGYEIYNKGACVSCHGAKNIYKRPTDHWKGIIDDMAARAALSSSQKDAVFKYVMAIKATQK